MNGILLIDKPQQWTSHDVVAKLRGVLHERRAGHSGTLDPLATGLLVVFLGRATRAVEFAEADEKEYIAGIRFGVKTNTQDITGEILEQRKPDFSPQALKQAMTSLTGPILQLPPMYSAIKVNGKKLYELARKGVEVERKARPVTISSMELLDSADEEMTLRIRCSKGTYIRTLCSDLGDLLGCGACMSSLRRTQAGAFCLDGAYTLEQVETTAAAGTAESLLLPVDSLFSDCDRLELTEKQEKCIRNGGSFSTNLPSAQYRAYSQSGEFLALTRAEDGTLRSIKSFYEV